MEEQKLSRWLEKSKNNDLQEIENHKSSILEQLQGMSKKDIIPVKEKLTLWQRIKKALNF
jgi:flagellar biosynthesis/type III secretory pathway chaperone